MTLIDLTASMSYKELYERKAYPNHSTKQKLLDFSQLRAAEIVASLEQASSNVDSPEFYLYFKAKEAVPRVLHRPMMKRSTMGENLDPVKHAHHDKLFLLEGDIGWGGECPVARLVSAQAFSETTVIKCPKLENWLLSEATADPGVEYVHEEIGAEVPEGMYDEIVTRKMQAIPKEFVKEVMENKLDARGLLLLVAHYCGDNEERLAVMEKFLEHLRVANCRAGRIAISRNSAPDALLTSEGREWVRRIVTSDVPSAFDVVPPVVESSPQSTESNDTKALLEALVKSQETTQQSLTAISKVMVDTIQGKETSKAPSKTIEGTWPTGYKKLMQLVGVTTVAKLPQVWHDLAKTEKNGRAQVVETLLYNEARTELKKGSFKFVVSNNLVKNLERLQFSTKGNIEQGINPFNSVVLRHHEQQAKAVENFNDDDEFLSSGVASLGDRRDHRKFKHAIMPKTASEFRELVTGYYLYLRVLFGQDHPLTVRYSKVYEIVEELTNTLEKWREPNTYERCLWGFHSRIDVYYDDVWMTDAPIDGPSLPDLLTFATNVRHRNPLPIPDWMSESTPARTPGETTKKPGSTKKPKEKENTDKNPNLEKNLMDGRVAAFIEKHGVPPKHDNDDHLCLTYHTKKAGCKKDCIRKDSHKPLTEAEGKRLAEYLSQE